MRSVRGTNYERLEFKYLPGKLFIQGVSTSSFLIIFGTRIIRLTTPLSYFFYFIKVVILASVNIAHFKHCNFFYFFPIFLMGSLHP